MNSDGNVITLPQLPDILLENIFKFLSYRDVNNLRSTCRNLYYLCGRYFRIGIRKLQNDVARELERTSDAILLLDSKNEPYLVLKRVPLYRKYNRLELLLSELNLVMVLCRHIIDRGHASSPIGVLVDAFLATFRKILADSHDTWSVMDFTSGDLRTKLKLFLDGFQASSADQLSNVIPIGVQIVDLLDVMLETDYDIIITYDLDSNSCEIEAMYEQRNPKFLSYTSQIPRRIKGAGVSTEEILELMKQLVLIVRIHNELFLRQEQYWREMDTINLQQAASNASTTSLSSQSMPFSFRRIISNQQGPSDFLTENILTNDPRENHPRIPMVREVLPNNRVRETYFKTYGPKTRYPRFTCKIKLKCTLDKAPLTIQKAHEQLLTTMETSSEMKILPRKTGSIFSSAVSVGKYPNNDEIYCVKASFHLTTPSGLSNDEIEMFEMSWGENNHEDVSNGEEI